MTLELLCDADKLEAMSDAELLEYYKPYLCVTRPEQANPDGKKKFNQPSLKGYENSLDFRVKSAVAMDLAKKMGIDLKL